MKKVFASAVAAALALTMAVPAFAATSGKISVNPDKANAKAGDKIAVEFKVEGVAAMLAVDGIADTGNIGAGELAIIYDPAQVTPTMPARKLPGFSDLFDIQQLTLINDESGAPAGKISMAFADTLVTGSGEDFSLGTMEFTVNEGVADGAAIEISVVAPSEGGAVLVTTSKDPLATEGPDSVSASITEDVVEMGKATVTVGDETTSTSDSSTSDDDKSTSDDGDSTTNTDSTSGDNAGNTTSGTGTSTGTNNNKPSNNNKTGDAGVLAIGGLMVLAAGATMLTLKKKSK